MARAKASPSAATPHSAYRHSRFVLRAIEPLHAQAISELFEGVGEGLPEGFDGGHYTAASGTLQTPLTRVSQRAKWLEALDPQERIVGAWLPATAKTPERLVGMAGLHVASRSPRRRHAMSIGMAVHDAYQGQGVGTLLMGALVDLADNWLFVLRLELEAYASNERALRLYESFGFKQEGLMRAHALRHGQLVDSVSMARLHPKPPTLP